MKTKMRLIEQINETTFGVGDGLGASGDPQGCGVFGDPCGPGIFGKFWTCHHAFPCCETDAFKDTGALGVTFLGVERCPSRGMEGRSDGH